MELISQGAEAILEREGNLLYKRRIPKNYRFFAIDNFLRKSRTKKEEKVLKQAKNLGIPVPNVYPSDDKFVIIMDYIDGVRLRDRIEEKTAGKDQLKIVGNWLAKLHDAEIVHGDLTTSNILMTKNNDLFLIDFGLSFSTRKIEDKAVDLHLLNQALESTHYKNKEGLFQAFLKGYKILSNYNEVLKRLDVVKVRGRNKH